MKKQKAWLIIALGLWGLSWCGSAAELYHTNRVFTAVDFDLQGEPTVYVLDTESGRLTNIVRGESIILDMTNSAVVERQAGITVGYADAVDAWNAAVAYSGTPSNYVGKIYDNVGWARGTRLARGEWGAYLWTLQNRIKFKPSATEWWEAPESGLPVRINSVLVGSLSNYPPLEPVEDIGPVLGPAATNFLGAGLSEAWEFTVDYTNVYYQLIIPGVWILPVQAYACVGGSEVPFLVSGTNIPKGVNWEIMPDLDNGAVIHSSSALQAWIRPGNIATNYKIRATSVDNPNFFDEADLTVLKVDIEQSVTNVWYGLANVTLNLTADSYLGEGTAEWSSQPAGISGSGPLITFNPSTLTPTTYVVRAQASLLTNCFDTCTVTVVQVDLEIYKPKVIEPLESIIPEADELSKGSVTFVNLDNDDNDSKFDGGGASPDDVVTGGDDELVKIKLKLKPSNLTQGQVKLLATAGAGNVAVWTNSAKAASSAYTLGTVLNVPGDFMVEGDSLVKTMWVEGIAVHTVQKGTTLKMEYTVDGITSSDEAALTVVGVDQIAWQGKANSVNDTDALDADTNWPGGLTPSALRVFPDARVVSGSVEANPRDKVTAEVTLTVEPPYQIKLFVKSFDVDDPTAAASPIDDETKDEDNRGLTPAKAGQFTGESGGVLELVFQENVKTTNCEFQVTMQPGDNFRIVANGDKDLLLRLGNKDSPQNVGATEAEKNANKQRICHGDVSGTPAEREIRQAGNYASDVLTVWRFLHVEVDSMTAPPATGAEKNSVDGNITAIAGNGTVAQRVTLGINLRTGLSPNDDSANLDVGGGLGRFEKGWIKLGSGSGTPGETMTTNLLGNGDDFVRKDDDIDIPALVSKTGQPVVNGKVIAWSGSTFTLGALAGTLSTNYNGGILNVAGIAMPVLSVSTNGGANSVSVASLQDIPFVLHDDDTTTNLPRPDVSGMEPIWKDAYIKPLFDTGYDTTNAPFHLYTPEALFTNHANESRGSPKSVSHYWVVLVKCGYQTDPVLDNDADAEGTWRAGSLKENVVLLEESIRDWIATPANYPGGGGGGLDPDPSGDAGRQPRRQEILNHEVGHRFYLVHTNGLSSAAGRLNGDVMLPSWGPPGSRQASVFGATSLDKIRKASQPQ